MCLYGMWNNSLVRDLKEGHNSPPYFGDCGVEDRRLPTDRSGVGFKSEPFLKAHF